MNMKTHKDRIKESFSKSAADYDHYAVLQKEMGEKLYSMLDGDYKNILDVGCGTGLLAEQIAQKYPAARVTGIDLAPGMINQAKSNFREKNIAFLVADGESLDFKDSSFDLVISSAALQWMDFKKAATECARVLKPGGSFTFVTFGPATLSELRNAGLSVNTFPDLSDLKNILSGHFKTILLSSEITVKKYNDIFEVISYLKKIGAQNPANKKQKGLLSKTKLESLFPPGEIAVSFETYYGSCRRA